MKLTIIIPMLNESARLKALFFNLAAWSKEHVEVIFVDGGSIDDSIKLVESEGYRVVKSARGRARQMNTGADLASGEYLLFQHADTLLPMTQRDALIDTIRQHPWGRFDVMIDGDHWMLPIIAYMINLRSRVSGIATGDQAMFVRRRLFEEIGGFPQQRLMEDIELSKRLGRIERPLCLSAKARTSGRRWLDKGVWTTILLMWRLRFCYWLGADPNQLADRYD